MMSAVLALPRKPQTGDFVCSLCDGDGYVIRRHDYASYNVVCDCPTCDGWGYDREAFCAAVDESDA